MVPTICKGASSFIACRKPAPGDTGYDIAIILSFKRIRLQFAGLATLKMQPLQTYMKICTLPVAGILYQHQVNTDKTALKSKLQFFFTLLLQLMKLDILAIAVHPDDAELGCAGTLLMEKLQNKKTGVLDLTRGELGTRGSVPLRAQESAAAAAILQLDIRENLCMAMASLKTMKRISACSSTLSGSTGLKLFWPTPWTIAIRIMGELVI
jgi:hypothetical protein